VAPIIPFVTEPEIERILEAAKDAGAVGAHYTVLRMPWEVNPLFQQWLHAHFPDRAQRVMNRIRDMRGGKDYDSDFGKRMQGEGIWADLIRQRFTKAIKRLGMEGTHEPFQCLGRLAVPAAAGGAEDTCPVGQRCSGRADGSVLIKPGSLYPAPGTGYGRRPSRRAA
jgi:hypothetical protein